MVECIYTKECSSAKDASKCKVCLHNNKRNYAEDHFFKASDKPIPDECPKLKYDGPAEQTMGYECPVCGGYTNPYMLRDKLCSCCGYKLNV